MAGALKRSAPALRMVGIDVDLPDPKTREPGSGRRLIRLSRRKSDPTVTTVTTRKDAGEDGGPSVTVEPPTVTTVTRPSRDEHPADQPLWPDGDGRDGRDGSLPLSSEEVVS